MFVLIYFIKYVRAILLPKATALSKSQVTRDSQGHTARPNRRNLRCSDTPRHTGHPDRAGPNSDLQDEFLVFDYIDLFKQSIVEDDEKLTVLFQYIKRCVQEKNEADLQHLVNMIRQRSLENGSDESTAFAPANDSLGAVEGSARPQLLPLLSSTDVVLRIDTDEPVPDVEEVFEATAVKGSKILHRRLGIGPQTDDFELNKVRMQFIESMRRARLIDKDCTLQIGSFVVLRCTDSGTKWWRLQNQWTPTITSIHRSRWSLFALIFGWSAHWTIRGANLQHAMLKAATSNKSENLKVLKRFKGTSGEEVLFCEEPYLVRSSAPMFQEKVYICASRRVEVEEEVTFNFNLQSEAKSVTKSYWRSVLEGLEPSPWTMILIISLLLSNFNLFNCFIVYTFSVVVPIFVSILWLLSHKPVPPPDTAEMAGPENVEADLRDLTGLEQSNNVTASQFFYKGDELPRFFQTTGRQEITDPKFVPTVIPVVPEKPTTTSADKHKTIVPSVSICCNSYVNIILEYLKKVKGTRIIIDYNIDRRKAMVIGSLLEQMFFQPPRRIHFKDVEVYLDISNLHP
ncbi:unnamed protein product [Calypogeia fissa]